MRQYTWYNPKATVYYYNEYLSIFYVVCILKTLVHCCIHAYWVHWF